MLSRATLSHVAFGEFWVVRIAVALKNFNVRFQANGGVAIHTGGRPTICASGWWKGELNSCLIQQ